MVFFGWTERFFFGFGLSNQNEIELYQLCFPNSRGLSNSGSGGPGFGYRYQGPVMGCLLVGV